MTADSIPTTSLITPGFAVQLHQQSQEWTDLAEADDKRRRLNALEHYVRGKEIANEVQGAARWAEVRIGQLLGPPERPRNPVTGLIERGQYGGVTPEERVWFRLMAANVDIVERCILEEKTSRAAVLNAIERHLNPAGSSRLVTPENAGTYRCLVIDPPWPMVKIERNERPMQDDELDYATMDLEEIRALDIASLADPDGCHVYLWVTQKFLPAGLDCFAAWGVDYQCLMTWVKNVGFTPFSWMYDTEHVLFGHIGSLPLERLGLRLSFNAPVTRHSEKPDVFFDRVTAASPEPRLELFARTARDGFDSWGHEAP